MIRRLLAAGMAACLAVGDVPALAIESEHRISQIANQSSRYDLRSAMPYAFGSQALAASSAVFNASYPHAELIRRLRAVWDPRKLDAYSTAKYISIPYQLFLQLISPTSTGAETLSQKEIANLTSWMNERESLVNKMQRARQIVLDSCRIIQSLMDFLNSVETTHHRPPKDFMKELYLDSVIRSAYTKDWPQILVGRRTIEPETVAHMRQHLLPMAVKLGLPEDHPARWPTPLEQLNKVDFIPWEFMIPKELIQQFAKFSSETNRSENPSLPTIKRLIVRLRTWCQNNGTMHPRIILAKSLEQAVRLERRLFYPDGDFRWESFFFEVATVGESFMMASRSKILEPGHKVKVVELYTAS